MLTLNNVLTIMKKELRRVFTDFRMVFSFFILPPLIIFIIYGLMGFAMNEMGEEQREYIPRIVVSNAPGTYKGDVKGFEDFLKEEMEKEENKDFKLEVSFVEKLTEEQLDDYKAKIEAEEIDLLIVFPEDFIKDINNEEELNVQIYQNINSKYNHTSLNNTNIYLEKYENALLQAVYGREELSIFTPVPQILGDTDKELGKILGMFLPFILIIFLMASAMGVGIESVSGEKERGTIATLLVTPIKRSQLAIGKILSVSIMGILSSIASFVGTVVAFPIYINSIGSMESGGSGSGIDVSELFGLYNTNDFLMLFAILIVAVLLFVSLVLVVSTFAKTLKESNALFMPVYIITMGISVVTMMSQDVPSEILPYLIPLYNIILGLKAIMFLEITAVKFLVVVGSTLLYTVGLGYIIQKMFKSEGIMFKQ